MSLKGLFKFLNLAFPIVLAYIFFYGIGSYGLLAKDEPRYAGCALEMIENNNWIVPQFNFEDRFDKPVLFYWLVVASYKLFGISSFSSRFPSALCAILLVLFTWYIGSKVLGKKAGLISAIILATSAEFVMLGRRAATDIVLCLFFSGSLYSLYLGYFVKDFKIKLLWTMLSGLFLGLSILTKGPVGILLLFTILTVFLIFRKQFDIKHLKIYIIILITSLVVSLPWYVAVHLVTNGKFTEVFFFMHNIQRFTSVVGEHPGPIWFYIPVLILGFMPWTLFLILALYQCFKFLKRKHLNKFVLFCLIWMFVIFFFFTFCKTKMFTYILPVFPPLALITGYWLNIVGRKNIQILKYILLFLLIVLICSSIVSYFLVMNLSIPEKELFLPSLFISVIFLLIGTILFFFFIRKYYSLVLFFVLVIAVPSIMMLSSGLRFYHKITFSDLCNFASTAKQLGAREIISFGGYKPILVYYGRVLVDFNNKKIQISKIKNLLAANKEVFIIGYLSDIKDDKPIVYKNKELFKRLKILKSGRKYFLGKFS